MRLYFYKVIFFLWRERLLYLNIEGLVFSQRELKASDGNLNRITQRRNLAHINLCSLRDAHVHDPAFELVGTMNFDSLGCSLNRHISQ